MKTERMKYFRIFDPKQKVFKLTARATLESLLRLAIIFRVSFERRCMRLPVTVAKLLLKENRIALKTYKTNGIAVGLI